MLPGLKPPPFLSIVALCLFIARPAMAAPVRIESSDSESRQQNGLRIIPDSTPSATTVPVTATTASPAATLGSGPIDVYLLAGQSNMQGTALTSDLPAGLLSIPEIRLYAAGSGVSGTFANQWVALRPSNGRTFGPEIGIGESMRDLCPGRPIALLKYASSGTSLELGWKPGANATDTANWGPQFSAFVATVTNGLAALEADGWKPVIKGMFWQQGEQDAKDGLNVAESDNSADHYAANLAHFVTRVRQQFAPMASPTGIRFVPGQVLPYAPAGGDVVTRFPGRDLVRQATLDADEDSGAALSISNTRSIPTNSKDHPVHEQEIPDNTDEVHLGAAAQLALGRSMAFAMTGIDSFAAGSIHVAPGSQVTLTWNAAGYDTLVIQPGGIDAAAFTKKGTGSTIVTVNSTTAFTLTATRGASSTSRTLRVVTAPSASPALR